MVGLLHAALRAPTFSCRLFYNGKVISVEPPSFVELLVVSTPPGIKGNTASGGELVVGWRRL